MDVNQIKKVLPHRYPFLLVDRVLEIEECERIVAPVTLRSGEQVPAHVCVLRTQVAS